MKERGRSDNQAARACERGMGREGRLERHERYGVRGVSYRNGKKKERGKGGGGEGARVARGGERVCELRRRSDRGEGGGRGSIR